MKLLRGSNVVDKGRRHHRRARAKDPALPDLVPGTGTVRPMGDKMFVAYTTLTGHPVVYSATPEQCWRFRPATPAEIARLRLNGNGAALVPTPRERYRKAIDEAFGALIDLEQRAAAAGTIPHRLAAE
jgi:hypothetical protein